MAVSRRAHTPVPNLKLLRPQRRRGKDRSQPKNGNMYILAAKWAQKGAKNTSKTTNFEYFSHFWSASSRTFHVFLSAWNATFSHIALQTCCLRPYRSTFLY